MVEGDASPCTSWRSDGSGSPRSHLTSPAPPTEGEVASSPANPDSDGELVPTTTARRSCEVPVQVRTQAQAHAQAQAQAEAQARAQANAQAQAQAQAYRVPSLRSPYWDAVRREQYYQSRRQGLPYDASSERARLH